MSEKKVSVLVAAYNIEKYIEKCLQSIIEQDYLNLEIIIVNDHSTDKTGLICDKYAKIDSRIRVIRHEKNKRLSAVRNTGLECATGEYIVFVDGDDWLAPDFVSYMVSLIAYFDTSMAMSKYNFTTRDMVQTSEDKWEIWSNEKATAEFLFPHVSIGAWNKIYRRDFIESHHLRFHEELITAEGYRFINDAAQRSGGVAVGKKKVYYYRLNNQESATTKPDIRQGVGARDALIGIDRDLIIRTPYVLHGLREHFWHNSFYIFKLIIETNSIKENKALLKECNFYLKKNCIEVAKWATPCKLKIKIIITAIFPRAMAKYAIGKQRRDLKRDNEV